MHRLSAAVPALATAGGLGTLAALGNAPAYHPFAGNRPLAGKRVASSRQTPRCDDSSSRGFAPTATPRPTFDRDWDRRHPSDESIACQGPTRVLLLVRHAQYETERGPNHGLLTDLGREQAKMTGQHIVARMRADRVFKKSMLSMTSSALERAIETADIMEREVVSELEWVDISSTDLPETMMIRFVASSADGYTEWSVVDLASPILVEDKDNLLQPRAAIHSGSRLRIAKEFSDAQPGAGSSFNSIAGDLPLVAVYVPLAPVKRVGARFDDWRCSGCRAMNPVGDIHWSDDVAENGLRFCDVCFAEGPSHSKLNLSDTFKCTTESTPHSPFRVPHDKNLNEADVDTCSILTPDDPLFQDYGELNANILRDNAAANAAFYAHMYRSVDHKRLQRKDRTDVIPFSFVSSSGEELRRQWTKAEFDRLDLPTEGQFPWIFDINAKERIAGLFTLRGIGGIEVGGCSAAEIRSLVKQQADTIVTRRPGKQIEVLVVHGNIIRYAFLKAMQFDTTFWLNLGGGNCTMTQLRITRRGDVICDFFADHGSKLPVSHYTYNKRMDV